ncbi:MAG: hypothetical protein ACI4OW_03375 [Alphaproteobacteria bacterium]
MKALMKKTNWLCFIAGMLLVCNVDAFAQMFGDETFEETPVSEPVKPEKKAPAASNRDILANPRARRSPVNSVKKPAAKLDVTTYAGEKVTKDEIVETEKRLSEQKGKKRYIPQVLRPTLDGSKRGRTSMRQVVKDGEAMPEDDALIFLYYSDFSLEQTLSGTIMCNVRFNIMTTLDRKLNNLSVRLKWPKLETTLSFISVNPNEQTYLSYTLLGEGCYTMDKLPNIVVNRCRVKNMTQQDCASRIRWLKKQ